MSVISGKNAILYFKIDGFYKPVACMETCNLTTTTEVKETSTVQTGTARTFRGNRNTWSVSCEGLVSFDENHPHVKLRQLQQTFTVIPISWTATDDNGITETFNGNVIITQLANDASASDFYTYQLQATGTGDYVITDIPVDPNECCQDAWIYYTGAGTEGKSVTIGSLIGRQIAGRIYRDGIEYRPSGVDNDGTGVPMGKQFKFDIATGKITFDSALPNIASAEPIDIPYNLCTSLAACNIVVNNVVPTADVADSNKFHITFLPTVAGVLTAPDDVSVRYSTDNGSTWHVPVSITYNPNVNYQLVVVNDALDTNLSYLFEVTPICNGAQGTSGTGYTVCIPVTINGTFLPNAIVNEPYDQEFTLSGTGPFTISDIVKPTWMTITLTGNTVSFTGTPTDMADNQPVSFTVHNCINKTDSFDGDVSVKTDTDAHFTETEFVSGDVLTDYENVQIQGAPGATATVTVTDYDNTNGGSLTFNGITVTTVGQTFSIALDGSGMSAVIPAHIDGFSGPTGRVIHGTFQITAVTDGVIGIPNTYNISKVF